MTDNQDSVTAGAVQPPTDRPLTAGDVPLLREGDVLRDYAGRTCVFDHMVRDDYLWARIGEGSSTGAGLGSFTFVVRPATSAASEGEGVTLAHRVYRHLTNYAEICSARRENIESVRDMAFSALASPPVSERERELAVLLDNLVIAQSLSRELRTAATDQARSYLYSYRHPTAQPAGEGK